MLSVFKKAAVKLDDLIPFNLKINNLFKNRRFDKQGITINFIQIRIASQKIIKQRDDEIINISNNGPLCK